MNLNPFSRMKHLLGVAIDWRVRDVLEAERAATVELGTTFVEGYARLMDSHQKMEERVLRIEEELKELHRKSQS